VFKVLEGKSVNLRVVEKEDLPLLYRWFNSLEFAGRYNPLDAQQSKAEIEKRHYDLGSEKKWFFIEKKDGSKIGFIGQFAVRSCWEIGYVLISSERGKGYCTEAAQLMVDYLFLSQNIVRIQAGTHPENIASQKVLEKIGFKRGALAKGYARLGKMD
jgi:ribosomal-protein-alanine N-acetyltransferase